MRFLQRGSKVVPRIENPAEGLVLRDANPGDMIGPGLAVDTQTTTHLVRRELDQHRGQTPLVLAPCNEPDLIDFLYGLGGVVLVADGHS